MFQWECSTLFPSKSYISIPSLPTPALPFLPMKPVERKLWFGPGWLWGLQAAPPVFHCVPQWNIPDPYKFPQIKDPHPQRAPNLPAAL